jgi:hypothetical protein
LKKRYSRKFHWHIEVVDVKNRNFILLHPANNAQKELDGCIAPVTKFSGPGLGLQSKQASVKLKNLVYQTLEREEGRSEEDVIVRLLLLLLFLLIKSIFLLSGLHAG